MAQTTGLSVRPATAQDREMIERFIMLSDYYAEYNEEFNEFQFPEDNCDALEVALKICFQHRDINAEFSTY
jgi:hypothetical protein